MSQETIPSRQLSKILTLLAIAVTWYTPLQSDDTTSPLSPSDDKCSLSVADIADLVGAHAESPWSQPVKGLRARIVLKWREVCNGTPIIAPFLELQNVSNTMNPMKLAWCREKMKFRVVDAQGHEPPPTGSAHSGPVLDHLDLVLPCRGTLSFDTSMGGWGIHGNKAGQLETVVFDRDDKDYYLHTVLEIPTSERGEDKFARPWEGRIEIPPVLVPLKPVKMEPAKVEPLIQKLGRKMLATGWNGSEEAARALSLIDDLRVIPWYLKAIDMNNDDLKCRALDHLAKFRDNAALEGIKKGMNLQEDDNIRHCAAWALFKSPHPEAKRLLVSMWNDPYYGVRNVVIHALEKMDSEESLTLLRKMSQEDPNEGQRNEALRCLKLRTGKEKKQ